MPLILTELTQVKTAVQNIVGDKIVSPGLILFAYVCIPLDSTITPATKGTLSPAVPRPPG